MWSCFWRIWAAQPPKQTTAKQTELAKSVLEDLGRSRDKTEHQGEKGPQTDEVGREALAVFNPTRGVGCNGKLGIIFSLSARFQFVGCVLVVVLV